MNFTYDKDSDDKVREIYVTSSLNQEKVKATVTYECHTKH